MPTREQAIEAVQRRGGYREAAMELSIPVAQAYLIVTGMPVDGGDLYTPQEEANEWVLPGSTQALAYDHLAAESPVKKPHVLEWVKKMAGNDPQMQEAAQARDAAPAEPRETNETDIHSVLTRDHDQVSAMLKVLKTIPGVSAGGDYVHLSRRESI